MTDPDLSPDCAHCDALCCVLLAFDASAAFAFDKPACVACPNLAGDNRCTIHADLDPSGFRGCISFDCFGAGQRLTQSLNGRSWRNEPALLPELDEAFRALRQVHELLYLLHNTTLPLTPAQNTTRLALIPALNATQDPEPARAFFRSLRL